MEESQNDAEPHLEVQYIDLLHVVLGSFLHSCNLSMNV